VLKQVEIFQRALLDASIDLNKTIQSTRGVIQPATVALTVCGRIAFA
jgi:hypothetical protein